jgi:hypothetical protein
MYRLRALGARSRPWLTRGLTFRHPAPMISPSTTRQLADGRSIVTSVVVVLAFLSSLVACGGGSGSEAASGVGNVFAQCALAACHAALEDKQAWKPFPVRDFNPSQPDASKFPEVAAWLEGEVTPTFERWRDDLVALGDPPSGQAAWIDTLAAVEKIVQLNADQIAAAKSGDTQGWNSATQGLGSTQTDLVAATEAAGIAACAEVHKA